MFKYYVLGSVIAVLLLAGIARSIDILDKKVITPIADRLAVREYRKEVMQNRKRQKKERWKAQTMRVATTFHAEDLEKIKKAEV